MIEGITSNFHRLYCDRFIFCIVFIFYYKIFLDLGSEHNDQISTPSTSRRNGGYSDSNNFNKNVTFKANKHRGNNNFRKSWDNKIDLVRQLLDGEFTDRNEQSRNNSVQRYLIIL